MNNDIFRAHGMTLDVSEKDLIEIELTFQKSRLDRHSETVNSVPTPPVLPLIDGFIQEFSGERFLIKPFSHRAVLYFNEHFQCVKTRDGGYLFHGRQQLGLTSEANFSYRMIDSEGFPI